MTKEDDIISHLEEIGASQEVIDEVLTALKQKDNQRLPAPNPQDKRFEDISNKDWKDRARYAAGIISKNLENGY